jgi:hypothetical protein
MTLGHPREASHNYIRHSLIKGSVSQGEACGTIELCGKRIHTSENYKLANYVI